MRPDGFVHECKRLMVDSVIEHIVPETQKIAQRT